MTNTIEKMREQVKQAVWNAIEAAVNAGELSQLPDFEITVEIPKEKGFGDFSTNAAMQMTKLLKKAPRLIAEAVAKNISTENTYIEKVEVAGPGFINFYLDKKWLLDALSEVYAKREEYGKVDLGKGQKVMVEFVSANPTGPLHMGNARGGALGDCIAGVLEAAGYDVTREFYINDAGNQIEKFGISLEARLIQELKGPDAVEFPEDGYHGEDLIDHVKEYIAQNGDKLLEAAPEERRRVLVEFALKRNLEKIKNDLAAYGIKYDVWFSEQSLYDSGELSDAIQCLHEKGYTVEKDGALWFKAAEFGAEKDEVIIRSNGTPTYFASDIAYHRNKFDVRKFDRVINLLGADHHGHVARMKAAVKALGINPDKLEFVIFQLVRLYRNGEIARMSKRTGRAITLADLLEEVGRDAARFFFNTRAAGSHLDFDLDLAVKQSNDNPVYYVQYAHARICSMLKILEEDGHRLPDINDVDLGLLKSDEETDLIRKLAELPEEIRLAAENLEPSRLTRYVQEVAALFHSFYNACRVRGEEESILKARMVLVYCVKVVLKNTLALLRIDAPEKM